MIPGFLFGTTTSKVRPELQEKILRYRRECYCRLWDAFKHEILSASTELASAVSGAQLAYELATACRTSPASRWTWSSVFAGASTGWHSGRRVWSTGSTR
jgi:hypothetical protein